MLSDQDQSLSDLSHVSLEDNQGQKTMSDRDSSDSESSDNAMDVTQDSLQDAVSSLDSQSSSLAANSPETTAARVEVKSSEETPHTTYEGERNAPKSTQDQTLNTTPTDTPTQQPVPEDSKSTTSQLDTDKGAKTTNTKEQKSAKKNSKNKKDIATQDTKQPALDQNANVEPNVKQTGQTKQKGNNQQAQKQKQNLEAERKAVGGSQTPTKVTKQSNIYEKQS